ncbi:nucleotide disphospho-sugar-binding domain-containing protein [Nonomuraea sp. NPDC048901]|uniref:nucleotide disphospho-sugar-binding domain-containing protein n=1 Tax=Nonomuraea sp. NPDC048901 TaxID=3155627 RepID=UPI003401B6EA
MRVLFTSWAWPTHFYPMVPLAWAFRTAGHDVLVATQPAMTEAVTRAGLPISAVGHSRDVGAAIRDVGGPRRPGTRSSGPADLRHLRSLNSRLYVRLAEEMIPGTLALARAWRPDLVVFEPTTYAGPVAAADLGVPAVRHLWGVDFPYLLREFDDEALAPLRARFDLDPLETTGAITVDVCPERMQVPPSPDVPVTVERLRARYLPYNGAAVMPGWLLTPPGRPRICVTGGTSWIHMTSGSLTGAIVEAAAKLDVEIVAAVTAEAARDMGPLPGNVRLVDGLALHLLLPSCAAFVSQGGMGSVMTALAYGVPQLVAPQVGDQALNAERLASTGAGRVVLPHEADPDTLRSHLAELLETPGYGEAAATLRAESEAQAAPARVVAELESLTGPRVRARRAAGSAKRTVSTVSTANTVPSVRAMPARPPARSLRVLFTPGYGGPGPARALVPLAWAFRLAGHEVRFAATPVMEREAGDAGLASVAVGEPADVGAALRAQLPAADECAALVTAQYHAGYGPALYLAKELADPSGELTPWALSYRDALVGSVERGLRLAGPAIGQTLEFARCWRPDLVVFGPRGYAGPLVARVLGVPAVRHLPGMDFGWITQAVEAAALEPLWARHGLADPDMSGTVTIDPCPTGMQALDGSPRLPVRFVPHSGAPGPLPAGAGRVCVAMGAESWWLPEQQAVTGLVTAALEAAAEVTGTVEVTVEVTGESPSLAEALRGCDVLVTAGDDASLLTTVTAGVPALVLPQLPDHAWRAHQFAATGAGLVVPPAELTADSVRAAVAELLAGTGHRAPLRHLGREMAGRPTYHDVVAGLPGILGLAERVA